MTHYLAITIGPIFDTLQQARKTRELWAASFLFSRLMELLREEISAAPINGQVLLPHKVAGATAKNKFGAGIYNDRLFAALQSKADPSEIETAINQAVEKLSKELVPKGVTPDKSYWRQLLRIEWASKPLESLENGALFTELSPLLDGSELCTPYFQKGEESDNLLLLLDKVYETKLATDTLPGAKGKYESLLKASNGLFPSTADFATFELHELKQDAYLNLLQDSTNRKKEDEEDQMDQFYESLYAKGSPFENIATDYHKYFCIVHADGDNLSSLNSTLDNATAYETLSEKLSNFALTSAGIINEYGGKPVFIGGDDLLFFAPVCTRKGGETVSVFQLIQQLSDDYQALQLGESALSFGITLTYYKFPLFEARQLSYDQLAYRAKKVKWRSGGEKNAIAFRLLKHSGAYFEGVLSKTVLDTFVKAEQKIRDIDGNLLSGIVYKMDTLSGLIEHLQHENNLENHIGPMFDNFFNEPVHRRNKDQMNLIQAFLQSVYKNAYAIKDESSDKNVYALLRLLKFVTDKAPKQIQIRSTQTTAQTLTQ